MASFTDYAPFYDLFYADKDYAREAAFVVELLREQDPDLRSVIEFGCGSGRHAIELLGELRELRGIDLSPGMIAAAEARRAEASLAPGRRLEFFVGDLRSTRLDARADAVVSLFHVLSYQTRDEDLERALSNARRHLEPGGLFLFDFWYGPAVRAEEPGLRERTVEDASCRYHRRSTPTHCREEQLVEVRFDFVVEDRVTGREIDRFHEVHRMRYFFLPEVEARLEGAGFELVEAGEWLERRPPSASSWGVFALARAHG